MLFALGLGFMILCIALHELAHWHEMERHGIRVAKAGLGIPIPYLTLRFTITRKGQPVELSFSPLLLGAFVQPAGDETAVMSSLPYRKVADIAGAGPITHLLIFSALTAGVFCADGNPIWGWYALAVPLLWIFRSHVASFLVPVLGLFCLYALVRVLVIHPGAFVEKGNGGPVAIGREVYAFSADLRSMVVTCANINLGIGLLNALPFAPLDGGLIVKAAIKPRFPRVERAITYFGILVVLSLVGLALTNDIRSFF